MILLTNNERIVIDNGMMYVEGNLLALQDHLTGDEGFLILCDDNCVRFFPTAYTIRYWNKSKWVYVANINQKENFNPYYKVYS